ncbi:MAG: hypothetical protein K0R71_1568 [Bacillales bacterium]|jgi:hypothetical protein|nr:hypothetical protein [Bacillales bacterium]
MERGIKLKRVLSSVIVAFIILLMPLLAEAKVKIPSSVYNIEKENTVTNSTIDDISIEPNVLAKKLIKSSNVKIENPSLVSLLNETQISKNPMAFWYRAKVFLGKWPLNYQSEETHVNWEYEKVNTNVVDNRGGTESAMLNYHQQTFKSMKGHITPDVSKNGDIQNMILGKVVKQTGLPADLEAKIGSGTKKENRYQVPVRKLGLMNAYIPAVLDKGKVTYGEVYLVLKGGKPSIEVKNVSTQKVSSCFPIQDYVSLKLQTANN